MAALSSGITGCEMKNTRSVTIKSGSNAALVTAPDGERMMFIRGDEVEGRFSTHERGAAIHNPLTDRDGTVLKQHD